VGVGRGEARRGGRGKELGESELFERASKTVRTRKLVIRREARRDRREGRRNGFGNDERES